MYGSAGIGHASIRHPSVLTPSRVRPAMAAAEQIPPTSARSIRVVRSSSVTASPGRWTAAKVSQ